MSSEPFHIPSRWHKYIKSGLILSNPNFKKCVFANGTFGRMTLRFHTIKLISCHMTIFKQGPNVLSRVSSEPFHIPSRWHKYIANGLSDRLDFDCYGLVQQFRIRKCLCTNMFFIRLRPELIELQTILCLPKWQNLKFQRFMKAQFFTKCPWK